MLRRISMLAASTAVYLTLTSNAVAADAPATAPAAAAPATSAGDESTKGQYALGYQLGRELSASPDHTQAMMDGVKDGRAGSPPKYTEQEMQAALQTLGKQISEQKAKTAAAESQKFLADNAKKPGVQTTASGLQYKVLTPGTGKQPKADDTVTVNYRGTLIDGTEFDSSYKRGQPATFPVNGVIAGWTEALQL